MISRRTVLASIPAVGAVAGFYGSLRGIRAVAQTNLPRRRSVSELALNDPTLETLREFVSFMTDVSRNGQRVSWGSFAAIHGSNGRFNLCPHRNWSFLPWHRAYIQMYEVAARSVTGNSGFALPYWDWTADREVPEAFAAETVNGQANPLFIGGRLPGSLRDETVGQGVMDEIFAEPNFEAFGSTRASGQDSSDPVWLRLPGTSGRLENTPHNGVHVQVGGPHMRRPSSALDPIFLMHHGNVDRIWAAWNSLGFANTDDPFWLETNYINHFIDPQGDLYSTQVSDLQDVEALGYSYGFAAPAQPPIAENEDRDRLLASVFGAESTTGHLADANAATTDLPLNIAVTPDSRSLEEAIGSAGTLSARSGQPQVYAIIRDIVPSRPENTQLRIFVNHENLSQDVPISDPHYAATIGFFGIMAHKGHGASVVVNLTNTLKHLERTKGLLTDEVVVQLLPTAVAGESLERVGSVESGEVELVIA